MDYSIADYDADDDITLAIVGDLQVNSTVGLAPEWFITDDGVPVGQSPFQKKLWNAWISYWHDVGECGGHVVGILNGDLVEGYHHHTTQIVSGNETDQHKMAMDVLEPARQVVDAWFVVRGTEAHAGIAAQNEEMIAVSLGAIPNSEGMYSRWTLQADFGGVRFDVAHHAPIGRLPWTTPNLLVRTAIEIELDYHRAGLAPPDYAIRSHNHRWGDTGINTPVRLIALPCWQGPTAHIHRIKPGALPHIGGAIFKIVNGQTNVMLKNYSARTSWIT